MNRDETKNLILRITQFYGRERFEMDKPKYEVWCECLSDLRADVADKALMEYVKNNKFPPTVADLREKYSELWEEYTAMIRHIGESFELASGCYPDITAEQRAAGKKTFIEIVNRYPRESKERTANEISQRILRYVREIENGTDTRIMPFDKYMEQIKHEFNG